MRLSVVASRLGGVTTALYRRYRPDSFADVVGQDHVTSPLMQALRADRVNHAYLFSGPRGCGKTTSARILARCLNCAEGPTDTPCGTCDSCVELARGGSGSVDVVEIDAASHNGVDDARELRERAAFAPARDRYKIFILDEAHMVTPQGFNALLKLVEEPPPHVRFIFATTEPDKVIGTIRSRTHHYPFRLVPPAILTDYLGTLSEAEDVEVASGVLPLVVRAGGGSVRDSLSVLDQLMAGSDEGGVTYERAIALLGFTDATLLDDSVDAIAAGDGASLFDVVDRVIGTGHEPRRFVEDLLERLRDLILLSAAGSDGVRSLGEVPEDQLERMKDQTRRLGLARASQAGDLVNDALTQMIGATSPRLHLELLCARLVAAHSASAGGASTTTHASTGAESTPAPAPSGGVSGAEQARAAVAAAREQQSSSPAQSGSAGQTAAPAAPVATPESTQPEPASRPAPSQPSTPAAASAPVSPAPAPQPVPAADPAPVAAADQTSNPPATRDVAGGAEDAELIRRRWDEVLATLERRRVTWTMVKQSSQIASVEAGVLTLAFDNAALAGRFSGSAHAENVALAVREALGLHLRVDAITDTGMSTGASASALATPAVASQAAPSHSSVPAPSSASPASAQSTGGSVASATSASGTSAHPASPGSAAGPPPEEAPPWDEEDEDISPDDAVAEDAQLTGADVVAQMLGGKVIEE